MNQLRKHLKFTYLNYYRILILKLRGLIVYMSVHVGKNVYIGRFLNKIYIGKNVVLKDGCHLCTCNRYSNISIGDNTTIGFNTLIYSSKSIVIGSDCSIAPFVYIVDSNHGIDKNQLINRQENKTDSINISSDVWIGAHTIILKGVRIGFGAVIAANSVVNCDIPEYEVWGGSPAIKIKSRH